MLPTTKTNEEVIEQIFDKKFAPIDKKLEKLDKLDTLFGEDVSTQGGGSIQTESKLKNILARVKGETEPKIDHSLSCPTCGIGHVHTLSTNNLIAECTGPNCKQKYIMTPKPRDEKDFEDNYFKCTACGMPIRKHDEKTKYKINDCPLCGNKKALKIDVNIIKRRIKENRGVI